MKLIVFKIAAESLMVIATMSKIVPDEKIRGRIADYLESLYLSLLEWYSKK